MAGTWCWQASTDNDYSVTQNGSPVQLDVYFKAVGGVASRIQCTIGTFDNCSVINANGTLGGAVPAGFDFTGYRKIPAYCTHTKQSHPIWSTSCGLGRTEASAVLA
jgi:hypothetical protein